MSLRQQLAKNSERQQACARGNGGAEVSGMPQLISPPCSPLP